METKKISKDLKRIYLTKDKTRKLTLMLNNDLVEMFKNTAKNNNITITKLVENWILKYLDDSGCLDD